MIPIEYLRGRRSFFALFLKNGKKISFAIMTIQTMQLLRGSSFSRKWSSKRMRGIDALLGPTLPKEVDLVEGLADAHKPVVEVEGILAHHNIVHIQLYNNTGTTKEGRLATTTAISPIVLIFRLATSDAVAIMGAEVASRVTIDFKDVKIKLEDEDILLDKINSTFKTIIS